MNSQNAEVCKSCNTRLNTSAAGTSASNQATPADAPENIAPYNPPEMSQEADTPADKTKPASTRAAFAQSNSQWLRRIGKTPPSETKPPKTPLAESAADAPAPIETPASEDWLKQLDTAATQTAAITAPTESLASTETAPKPQLSEIKLTGDDYDYSDIGGEVTDEMKAQLQAEAGNVQSVDDEVALAMRLLGLSAAGEAIPQTAKPQVVKPAPPMPAPVEPVAQMQTAAPETAAEPETPAPLDLVTAAVVSEMLSSVVSEPAAAIETPVSTEPIAAAEVASETLAPIEATPPAKPQLSEIKLTGDDYDYSDIGGEVTDEMKAQLQAEAGNVQSVDDEVALAMRLLGLGAAGTAVASAVSPSETVAPVQAAPSTEPIAQASTAPEAEAVATPVPAPTEPIAETETALPVSPVEAVTQESAGTIAAVAPEEAENAEWLTRLAAASSAAVAAKMVGEARAESAEPKTTELSSVEQIVETTAAETPAEIFPPQDAIVAAAAADTSNMPEWLRELAPPEVTEADAATAQDNIPNWVQDLAPGAAVIGTTAFLSHLPDLDESERGELPDWLREPIVPPEVEAKTELAAEAEQAATEAERVSHAPVELPSWMRGGGTAGYDPYEMVETTGPLAGVSGILPLAVALTEPHTLTTATPPRTDSGRIFQTLLAEPLTAAAPAQPETRAARMFTSIHLLYLLIFLAAMVALFLPSGADELGLLGKDVVSSPGAVFYDQLAALPAQSTALMAFDYVPGQSPELDPAARAILGILAARQVNVIALSSNPNGAVMAQSLLEQAKQAHPDFTFTNLGFIPGNEAGLKTLALGWLPSTYTDASGVPWNQSPLSKTVRGMDDLALSILILGEPNGLNGWMTQVQPIVKSPMIAATTAAIEPQARIYVNSKQLNASLRGLTGAAELELWSGNSGRAVKTVNALSFVSLALAGIIIATNLVWLMKRKKR